MIVDRHGNLHLGLDNVGASACASGGASRRF